MSDMSDRTRLIMLLNDLSEDVCSFRVERSYRLLRSYYPDIDIYPNPDTDAEVGRRVGLFYAYILMPYAFDPGDAKSFRRFELQTQLAKQIFNRLSRYSRQFQYIRDDAGWYAAIRTARRGKDGGMQLLYNDITNYVIGEQIENYQIARIRDDMPVRSGIDVIRPFWNAIAELMSEMAGPIEPVTEVQFYMNREDFLIALARDIDELRAKMNVFGEARG